MSPKAAFAFEAAKRLRAGKITLEELKDKIIEAANSSLEKKGAYLRVYSLTEVQKNISGTPHAWFNEIKRVSSNDRALEQLIAQHGEGLTALYRFLGPTRASRVRGSVNPTPADSLKPLKRLIEDMQRLLKSDLNQQATETAFGPFPRHTGTWIKHTRRLLR